MRVTCKHCGGAHPAYDCRKKSTAVLKETQDMRSSIGSGGVSQITRSFSGASRAEEAAGTQAMPVDTNSANHDSVATPSTRFMEVASTSAGTVGNKDRQHIPKRGRGRPRTITDMKVYKAMKQREYRARKK